MLREVINVSSSVVTVDRRLEVIASWSASDRTVDKIMQ